MSYASDEGYPILSVDLPQEGTRIPLSCTLPTDTPRTVKSRTRSMLEMVLLEGGYQSVQKTVDLVGPEGCEGLEA